jgi:hypothetical protein
LTVEYESFSITSNSNTTKQYTFNDTNVLLDSGTTFNILEESLVEEIYMDLGVTVDTKNTGYPLIDCAARSWSGGISFGFGDKVVTATYRDLIFTASGLCALGIQSIASGGQQVLGVPFLRSAYGKLSKALTGLVKDDILTFFSVVYDFDNEQIHIAQAGNCTEDLTTIGSGPRAVPNVTGSCFSTPTPAPLTSDAKVGADFTRNFSFALVLATMLAMITA